MVVYEPLSSCKIHADLPSRTIKLTRSRGTCRFRRSRSVYVLASVSMTIMMSYTKSASQATAMSVEQSMKCAFGS